MGGTKIYLDFFVNFIELHGLGKWRKGRGGGEKKCIQNFVEEYEGDGFEDLGLNEW